MQSLWSDLIFQPFTEYARDFCVPKVHAHQSIAGRPHYRDTSSWLSHTLRAIVFSPFFFNLSESHLVSSREVGI